MGKMQQELIRTRLLIGDTGLDRLKGSKVCLLGLGGVGGAAFEALVRGGVGTIVIVDNDIVTISNLNRQMIATYSAIGKTKVSVAFDRAAEINRYCKVIPVNAYIQADNLHELIPSDTDYVIDAIDTVTSKLAVITYCKEKGIRVISAMGTGNKFDPSMLRVMDLAKTRMCPLAKIMRKELRRRGIYSTKVVASMEKPMEPLTIDEPSSGPASLMKGKRQTPGSTSFVPPAAGYILAGEVIRELLDRKAAYQEPLPEMKEQRRWAKKEAKAEVPEQGKTGLPGLEPQGI
jgi:tRNA A37 threonylcarbamoyladenosine dehydratase